MQKYENKLVYEKDGKEVGRIEYQLIDDKTIEIIHTYVDQKYRGEHIASILTEELFKMLKQENKKAICSCSYAASWIKKHPEYSEQVL